MTKFKIDPNTNAGKMILKQHPELQEKPPPVEKKKSKLGNVKTPYDGYIFDSKTECQMYKLLKRIKFPEGVRFEIHKSFVLSQGFEIKEERYDPATKKVTKVKRKIQDVCTEPDFVFYQKEADGTERVVLIVDVKGHQTALSKVQMKLLRKLLNCPIVLPRFDRDHPTDKYWMLHAVYDMLSAGIFAHIKF